MKLWKKIFSVFCSAAAAAVLMAPAALATEGVPPLPCEAYIVIDADTGQVLVEQNADEVRFPASITKIMTMALAMEKAAGDWDQTVTVSYDAVHQLEARSTHIALQEGEVVALKDVLYGTELESANDGANVLAEFISEDGTIQGGVAAMNQKAAELGLEHTHFMNPHGLHHEEHHTTARDMAEITRWALTVPGFEEVFCRNENWVMEPTNLRTEQRVFHNTDWMRISGDYYRDYAKGSKMGFHDQARTTFVNYAQQGDVRLISVEMGCPQLEDKFRAACALLDYVFAHFHWTNVPAPQDSFPVALVGGGGSLGNVTVKAVDTRFLLHDSLNATDVKAEYNIPDQYVLGRPFEATVTYSLRENTVQSTQLGGGVMEVDGMPEILKANTYIPPTSLQPEKNPVGMALGAGAAMVALLLAYRLLHRSKEMQGPSNQVTQAEWDFITRQPLPSDETIYLSGTKPDNNRPHGKPM